MQTVTHITMYDPEIDATIHIDRDTEDEEMIRVHSRSENYGKMNFAMDVNYAEELAKNILRQVKFIREGK